jgi:hypothetical protein
MENAQGIEAVSFFAYGKKDTSVKPGFRRFAPEMRPKYEDENFHAFSPHGDSLTHPPVTR